MACNSLALLLNTGYISVGRSRAPVKVSSTHAQLAIIPSEDGADGAIGAYPSR